MEQATELMLASVPLHYTYLIKSNRDPYVYESNTGLWANVPSDNQLILSLIPQQLYTNYTIIDNFNTLKPHLSSSMHELLSVSDSRANESLLNLQIDSSTQQAGTEEHIRLLQHYQKFDFKSIQVERSSLPTIFSNDNSNELSQEVQTQLHELSRFCNVEILVSNRVEHFNLALNNEELPSELVNQQLYFYILGDSDNTTFAETRLRIILDTSRGLFADSLEIPLSLIPLVGGVGFGNFNSIAKETGVNVYIPTFTPELFTTKTKHNLNVIFLSGLESQVFLAKKMITDIHELTQKKVYYKSIQVLKYKKNNILINRKNEVNAIMYKYGTFIQCSPLGHDDSNIHFQAVSPELVELAVGDFNSLSNEIYECDLWFHTKESNEDQVLIPVELQIDEGGFKTVISKISIAANVMIYSHYTAGSFKIVGLQDDCLKAIKLFKTSSIQFYSDFQTTIRFKIELGLSYHEFISGKKNGKIAKITNGSQCTFINFHPLNEYNLILEIESSDFTDFLNSFAQLQQEFPSEVKFYIPESFHRQIIGTGGILIQSIMRKYNVFVKFSNSYDLKNNVKSHVRYDNVIIRCPSKNGNNIPLVKNELNSLLINNENVAFFNTFFKMSRNQYRLLGFDKIQEIEKKTSTFVKFPSVEPNDFAIVEVLGTETHSINATKLIIAEMAESYEFRITSSPTFHKVINDLNEKFVEKIKVPFKLLYKFEIMTTDKKSPESGSYHAIIISYPPDSDLFLEDAITHLTAFLREYEFTIMDRGELSNNDMIINGSASRLGLSSSSSSSAPSSSSSSTFSNSVQTSSSTTASSSYPLQLPLTTQQLYQLPNIHLHQRFNVGQPTLVQPYNNGSNGNGYKKRGTGNGTQGRSNHHKYNGNSH